jgi:carbon starvation protein CstA
MFQEIKSSFLDVTAFLNLRVVTLLVLMKVSLCIFCSADTGTKILRCALYNSALKWTWNSSHAFMVLNDEAAQSDQTGGGKMEPASI